MIAQENMALIDRARQRDSEAFSSLCVPCITRLKFFLMSCGAEEQDCEDLIQDTFLRAWRGIEHFRGDAAVSSWLTKIAYNVLVEDARRKKCRIQAVSLDTPEFENGQTLSGLPDPEVDIHADAENRELVVLISRWVHPKRFRLLWMRFAEGMSVKDVMRKTGENRTTVKSATVCARLNAQRVLEQRANIQIWM